MVPVANKSVPTKFSQNLKVRVRLSRRLSDEEHDCQYRANGHHYERDGFHCWLRHGPIYESVTLSAIHKSTTLTVHVRRRRM